MHNQRFPIGLEFSYARPSGQTRLARIDDYHVTRSVVTGDIVKARYVVSWEMMGQRVRTCDVADTTIARALDAENRLAEYL